VFLTPPPPKKKALRKRKDSRFSLKVHKHEIICFFLPKSNSLLFLRFSPEFRSSNIFAVTEHTRNQIFLERYPPKFFFQNVHLGPIRWFPKWFYKIWIFYSRNFHFNLGILSNFQKLSLTEQTPKKFSRMLSQRKNVFTCTIYAEHTGK
jgi:hypothetical protein